MTRVFKDPAMQRVYDLFRKDPPSGDRVTISMRSACGSAYMEGFHYPAKKRQRIVQGTPAYAAWAAGVDNAKQRAIGPRPQLRLDYGDLLVKSDNGTHILRRCSRCHQVLHSQPRIGADRSEGNRGNAAAVLHWKERHPDGYRSLLAKWQRIADERERRT